MSASEAADPLVQYVSSFRRHRVLILGDAILDEYLLGSCSRISPEAPVPVLKVNAARQVLGGAANTAANVLALGGRATLISFVGSDEAGRTLGRCCSNVGVDLRAVDHGLPTLRKTRVVGQHQQIVRLDYEEWRSADPMLERQILALFDAHIGESEIVVISDYAKGFLSPSLGQEIIRRSHGAGCQVIVDPRPQHRDCYAGCDYLTPNWKEARALLRMPDAEATPEESVRVARTLAADLDTTVVLTLGAQGIQFCSRDGSEQFALPTLAREVFDVSGAGDTVVAAFALARASGADHPIAGAIANRAASVVVGKFGTATVTADEILQGSEASRRTPRHALAALATSLRTQGKRITTISGSFDGLHAGHVRVLNDARQRGDVLIVALDSDASIMSRTGANGPLVPERQRADMLLALRVVDYVHIVDAANPTAFLQDLSPDVHVDRDEYGEERLERELRRDRAEPLPIVNAVAAFSASGSSINNR